MDMPRRRAPVDSEWFTSQIAERFPSQAAFAKRLRSRYGSAMDPSALSRFLRGGRGLLLEEAQQMADVLKLPLGEVLKRAGLPSPQEDRQVPIAGWIDDEAAVHTEAPQEGAKAILGPMDLPPKATAYVVRAGRGSAAMDGATLFAGPVVEPGSELVGRLCIVGFGRGKAPALLAYVRRSPAAERYTLLAGMCGHERREAVAIAWAAPVLYIRP